MNILKKASLLIPFILMGMLLLSSHTTTDSTIFTDEFEVGLVTDGKRTGDCNDHVGISKNSSVQVYSIDITVSKMVQIWFFPIYEKSIQSPNFGNGNYFDYDISAAYQHLDGFGSCCPIVINTTLHTSNGTFTVTTWDFVSPSCQ